MTLAFSLILLLVTLQDKCIDFLITHSSMCFKVRSFECPEIETRDYMLCAKPGDLDGDGDGDIDLVDYHIFMNNFGT